MRTLANLLAVDPGFRTEKILSAQVSLFGYVESGARAADLLRQITDRMEALPGAFAAAAVSNMPLHETPVDYRDEFSVEGRPRKPGETTQQAEIAVRMALGARRSQIVLRALDQGMRLALWGMLLGAAQR